MSPRARGEALVLVGLAAAALLFWQARVIAPARELEGFFQIDFFTLLYPMYHYGFQEIAAGRIPLWNPYAYCGIPLLATLYGGFLYPGNFLFLLLPTGLAMGMTVVLHTFFTAWVMYLLGRAWRWSPAAALAAAVTWAFSQNAVWFYGPICFLESAAWIPLLALGIERACSGSRRTGAALVALGGAMSLLAGGMQTLVYGAYALAAFGAARLWRVLRAEGAARAALALIWLVLGGITAVALAAPQILPTYGLSARTERAPGRLPIEWTSNPMDQPHRPQPALPSRGIGGPSEPAARALRFAGSLWTLTPRRVPSMYFGILPPLLAVAALFGRRRGLALAVVAGACLAFALSLGPLTPLYSLYHWLPTGAWFRNSNRMVLLLSFAMAALVGLGLNAMQEAGARGRRARSAAWMAVLCGVALLVVMRTPSMILLQTAAVAAGGLLLASAAFSTREGALRRAARIGLPLFLFGEFFVAYSNPFGHPQKDAGVFAAHAAVSGYVRAHVGSQRVLVVDEPWGSWAIQPKYGLLHRVRTLNDYEPLTPAVYKTLFSLLERVAPDNVAPFDGRINLDPARMRKKLLDLLAVRYIVIDRNLNPAWDRSAADLGLARVITGDPEIALYENPVALPRATLVENAVIVASETEAVEVLNDPEFDPRRMAVVQSAGAARLFNHSPALRGFTLGGWKAKAYGPSRDVPGTARILRDEPGRVEIEATVPPKRAAWLVLMDLNDPGWTATVDGGPATVLRANLVGRALGLPAGSHRVIFTYEAPGFRLGCLVALLAAGLWAFGALAVRAFRRGMGPGLLARRILPWLVAFGILAFLVRQAGIASLRAALAEADLRLLLVSTLLCTLPMYLLDVLSLARVITWFNRPISFREIAPVKAAVYLINIVNYNAGSGAVALWLKRRKGIPFLEGAASVLFMNVVDAALLVAFMAAGLPALSPPVDRGVALLVGVAGAALAGHFLYWQGGVDFVVLGRVRGWPIFRSFRLATVERYLRLALLRFPFDLFFILNFWLALRAFGIDVPFLKTLAFVPLILFIAVVPVTVSGLGTVQAATVYLFSSYAPEAKILAFSLVFTVALNGVRAALGVPVFRRVSDEIFSGSGKEKEDGDQVAAS